MKQTPVHDFHNPEILQLMPTTLARVVEVGCSSGALAREYKQINGKCHYLGIEIDENYASMARRYCDEVVVANIEGLADEEFARLLPANCWIFGDVLEHLYDPWSVLARIRKHMTADDCVIACIPNVQHWSVQASLMAGQFFYQDSGLFDRTHVRWFTRTTIIDMFTKAGFRIEAGIPRIFDNSAGVKFIEAIRSTAELMGMNANIAVQDALPLQYVVKAVPS